MNPVRVGALILFIDSVKEAILQSKAKQSKAKQNKTKQNKTKQNKTTTKNISEWGRYEYAKQSKIKNTFCSPKRYY